MADRTIGVVAFAAVGGILFGLDQGNWGGAIVKEGFVEAFCGGTPEECRDAATLPPAYAQFLSLGSSLLQLGAAFGALGLAPLVAGHYGRREAMFLGSLVTILGCLPQAVTTLVPSFLAARFLAGIGVGVVTYALPMFVSEVAPAALRGMLGCFMQLTMVLGTLVASVLNCQPWFEYKYSFAMPAVPAAVVAIGIFCFPMSPRFALMKGQRLSLPDAGEGLAWKSLRRLRGSDAAADGELAILKASLAEEQGDAPWSRLWKSPSIRRRVLIANMLQWLQQFTGVNAILSYGPAIFQSAQVPLSNLSCAVVTNAFNLAATVAMMLVIDRLGRRTLLLLGAAAMLVFMSLSAVLAHMISCAGAGDPVKSTLGWCLLGCVCLYMASFAIAWGGVPWVYPSEIFPMSVKEKALSTSVCSQWTANFVIAYVIPQQVQALQVTGTFMFYAACLAASFGLVYQLVPETKGLELEEMDALFGEPQDSISEPLLGGTPSPTGALAGTAGRPRSGTLPSMPDAFTAAELVEAARVKRSWSEGDRPRESLYGVRSRIRMSPGGSVALY